MPTVNPLSSYLLVEDGGHIILEDNSGFILLEVQSGVTSADTHDGIGWVRRVHNQPQESDRFDRQGIRAEIDRILSLAKEELPHEAMASAETALQTEILRETADPVLLAAELQRLTAIADITQSLYDAINELAMRLYAEQDDEDAIMVLLQSW